MLGWRDFERGSQMGGIRELARTRYIYTTPTIPTSSKFRQTAGRTWENFVQAGSMKTELDAVYCTVSADSVERCETVGSVEFAGIGTYKLGKLCASWI